MAENDSLFGKTGEAFQAWFRTFMFVLRDRRALLLSAPDRTDKPMPPVAFMLAGVAVVFGVTNIFIPKAPEPELPATVSALQQLLGMVDDVQSLLIVATAVVSAATIWACFRLFRLKLTWQSALRQTAYFSGAQTPPSLLLALVPLALRGGLGPWSLSIALACVAVWLLAYLVLVYWVYLQYADEAGVRPIRTLPPFSIALVIVWALMIWGMDAQPYEEAVGFMQSRMAPAIQQGDHLRINRWVLLGRDPGPGEVVTFSPADASQHRLPFGGAFQTAKEPLAARVIAGPADRVAARGAELMVNDHVVAREPVEPPPGLPDGVLMFREYLGGHSFQVSYNTAQAPQPCLGEAVNVLPAGHFLVAYDMRPDDQPYCAIFPRARISGLVDWNERLNAPP